jgi:phosphatidylglycerol:prolipoprotein diacylglycerol transferase
MPNGFWLGPLHIRFYSLLILAGALLGGWVSSREAARRGHDPEIMWDVLLWLLVGGVVGARLWHVFSPMPSSIASGVTTEYYLAHPLEAIAVWRGGLGIPGGVIGGLLALYLYVRRRKLKFAEWADICAPGLALGQAIGRWGNFFNQELYGPPTNLPWKIYIDPLHRIPKFANDAYYQPLFLYESLWDLANMAFLLWLARRHGAVLRAGDVFLVYMIVYGIGRFLLEFIRVDASRVEGINFNQTVMAAVVVGATVALAWRHRPTGRTGILTG